MFNVSPFFSVKIGNKMSKTKENLRFLWEFLCNWKAWWNISIPISLFLEGMPAQVFDI